MRVGALPPGSLLSRMIGHYPQLLTNKAPAGFEAEFVNARGRTTLYRAILLPYSSTGQTIDFMRENDPRMPLFSERKTTVSFGRSNQQS